MDFDLNGPVDGAGVLSWPDAFLDSSLFSFANGQRFNGQILPNGGVNGSKNFTLTLGGFTAATGFVELRNDVGLHVNGTFDLMASVNFATIDFGDLFFDGVIRTDGSYDLSGTGQLNLGGLFTDSRTFTLKSSGGLFGNSSLPFANRSLSLNNLKLFNTGISFDAPQWSGHTGWQHFGANIYAAVVWNASLPSASNGTLQARLSGTWAVWNANLRKLPVDDMGNLDLDKVQDLQKLSFPEQNIGANGVFSFDKNFGGFNKFTFGENGIPALW